ncbi:porin family protein [Maribacter sp. 2210JD10-5]|uniref:porin family protein n=1 Tax=Maribacter sp. 2210JD10-5 TaxID=3386272 RepID=UPI0039BCC0E8
MKKLSLFIVLFSIGIFGLSAQDDMRFGAKAGLNVSSLGNDFGATPGFHVGGALEIPFSDKIILQPEALISFQGSDGIFQDNLRFTYLTIPVMAKYNVWDELYVEAGPYLALLLADNLDGDNFGTIGAFEESNSIDFGLGVGAGYRLNDNFYFQLRFSAGAINAIEDVSSKNNVFQASAIYFF